MGGGLRTGSKDCIQTKDCLTGQASHFRLYASVRSDYGISRYIDETKRLFSVIESRLNESSFLAGDKYTIADIASYTWIQGAPAALEIDLSEYPALEKWVSKIGNRSAVQKGKSVPDTGRTEEQRNEAWKSSRAKIDAMMNSDKH